MPDYEPSNPVSPGYDQSLLHHSIRIYDGYYMSVNVPYRIQDNTRTVQDRFYRFYDTWNDFHLIPTERPTVPLPKANTKLVSIPGRKHPMDLSTYLTGHETYGNRTGSWSFYTDVDFVNNRLGGWVAFDKQLHELFHGKFRKIILRDDPYYFYAGELTVGQWKPGDDRSTVTISYNLYPFKKSVYGSRDLWRWDDFAFYDGYIMYLQDMEVNGERIVEIYGERERISPYISGSAGISVSKWENNRWKSYGSVPTASISSSNSIIPGLVIDYGLNQLKFNGRGVVTIDYRRGLL